MQLLGRKTCPTNRGLRPNCTGELLKLIRRKTCPTNRGLRHHSRASTSLSRVGRLAPQIGDYDRAGRMYLRSGLVGRLAPQIGDYDSSDTNSTVNLLCRKTCPTNRGLRQSSLHYLYHLIQSEDLPHKSGITTKRRRKT